MIGQSDAEQNDVDDIQQSNSNRITEEKTQIEPGIHDFN